MLLLTRTRREAAGLLVGIVALGAGLVLAHAQSKAEAQQAEIERLIKLVDRSNTGKFSFDDAKQFVLDRFDKLDPDRDGTLTLAELQAPLRERMNKAKGTEKNRLQSSLKLLEAEFKAMDKDKDGTVDKNEYVALLQTRFDAANRDKDQTLEPNELKTAAGQKVMLLLGALVTPEGD